MKDPIIIEREDLFAIMESFADKLAKETADKTAIISVRETLTHLGIKAPDKIEIEITQHAAWKLIPRTRLNKLMKLHSDMWRKEDENRPHSRVWINRKSLDRYIKNPQL